MKNRDFPRNSLFSRKPRKIKFFATIEIREKPRKTTKIGGLGGPFKIWTAYPRPPKIIKNRLNFALSEKFTYVRKSKFWQKFHIFGIQPSKFKIFFSSPLSASNISKIGDFGTDAVAVEEVQPIYLQLNWK